MAAPSYGLRFDGRSWGMGTENNSSVAKTSFVNGQ